MDPYSLGEVEGRFADLVWEHAPLPTKMLIALCQQELGWKRTTTYTVLKKFIGRGIFENQGGVVTALVSRQEFYARQSERYVEKSFGGSLPGFLTAFTSKKKLSQEEIEEIEGIIHGDGGRQAVSHKQDAGR